MTLTTGIYDDLHAETYHADPCPEPSLSSGVAHRLVSRSPLHAWAAHPRLNPNHEQDEAGHLDFGTAAHALLLQGTDVCRIVEYDDWRKQAARDERDQARADGLVPMLRKDAERMLALVDAVKKQLVLSELDPLPLSDGKPEQTIIWQEGDVWCRARIDWLHATGLVIDDLKSTGTTADPRRWSRHRLFADGKDVQAALYLRGLRTLTGADATWRFVVVETEPPYGLSVISLAPSALELASRKVDLALRLWRECLQSNCWPGYSQDIFYAEAPSWEEAEFLEAHWQEEGVAA